MKQQTAVEWLALRYHHRQGYLSQEDIEQAKQMEKEQIIKAVDSNFNYDNNGFPTLGEQYYNEAYGKAE